MLHIQKQNRFFKLTVTPEGQGAAPTVNPEKDLRTWQEVTAHNEAYNREREAIVWYTQKGLTSMVDDIQTALVKAGYNIDVDGEIGPATIQAIMKFQRDHGLIDDWKTGRKTMAKLWITSESNTAVASNETSGEVSSEGKGNSVNRVQEAFSGRDKFRAQIDTYISADKTPELIALWQAAAIAKVSNNKSEIVQVYNQIKEVLPKYIKDEKVLWALDDGFWGTKAGKIDILDFFSNALKGNAQTAKVAAGELPAEAYLIHNSNALKKSENLVNQLGLSFARESHDAARYLTKDIKWALSSTSLGKWIYFSVRTQWNLRALEPQTRGAEATIINGANLWETSETKTDMLNLAMRMNENQLSIVAQKIQYNGTLSREELVSFIEAGKVTLNVQMYIEENCSNMAYKIVPKGDVSVPVSSSSNDTPTPVDPPPVDPPPVGPTSIPGEDGGGDEGGGGTDGDQGETRDEGGGGTDGGQERTRD